VSVRTEAIDTFDALPELPEDFTSAWATVLLDIWEKQSPGRSDQRDDGAGVTDRGARTEDERHGA
jgi:hypothetical protein